MPLDSTEVAAAAAGVHPETLRRLHRAGKIPGYKFGRVLRFDIDEVRAALRTRGSDREPSGTVEPDLDALDRIDSPKAA